MTLKRVGANYNSLDFLQQPIHPGQGKSDAYWSLLAAVDYGWQVAELVKKCPSSRYASCKYEFVITHRASNRVCTISVPESPDIDHFIFINDIFVENISSNSYLGE